MRRAARIDSTHTEIVRVLRQLGVAVYNVKKPVDLLCFHRGVYYLVEVKGSHKELTKEQEEFMQRWPGPVHVVRTPDDAIRAVMGDKVMA
jgi:Holliday junction resolvase